MPERHVRCSQKCTEPPCSDASTTMLIQDTDKFMLKWCSEEYKSVLSKLDIDTCLATAWVWTLDSSAAVRYLPFGIGWEVIHHFTAAKMLHFSCSSEKCQSS